MKKTEAFASFYHIYPPPFRDIRAFELSCYYSYILTAGNNVINKIVKQRRYGTTFMYKKFESGKKSLFYVFYRFIIYCLEFQMIISLMGDISSNTFIA